MTPRGRAAAPGVAMSVAPPSPSPSLSAPPDAACSQGDCVRQSPIERRQIWRAGASGRSSRAIAVSATLLAAYACNITHAVRTRVAVSAFQGCSCRSSKILRSFTVYSLPFLAQSLPALTKRLGSNCHRHLAIRCGCTQLLHDGAALILGKNHVCRHRPGCALSRRRHGGLLADSFSCRGAMELLQAQ